MSAKGFWFAFSLGASAGAAAALLYAPQPGTKTRKQLRRTVYEAADYLDDASDYLRAQADILSSEAQRAIKVTTVKVTSLF